MLAYFIYSDDDDDFDEEETEEKVPVKKVSTWDTMRFIMGS